MDTATTRDAARPTMDTVVEQVRRDCELGLARVIKVSSFELADPTPSADDAPIGNDSHTAVAWKVTGIHEAEDQVPHVYQAGQPRRSHLVDTLRHVEVTGLTVVSHPPSGEPWRYSRFVDWNGLAAQIGVALGCASTGPERRSDP